MDIGSWVGIIMIVGCAIYFSLYFTVKKATKDALKEFIKENKEIK